MTRLPRCIAPIGAKNSQTSQERVDALRKALESGLLVRYTDALLAAAMRGGRIAPPRAVERVTYSKPIADAIEGETYNGAAVVRWLRSTGRMTWNH